MSVAFVQKKADESTNIASGVTVTLDAGATAGNLLVAAITKRSTGAPDVISGWTALDSMHSSGADNNNLVWFYKIAAGGETAIVFTSSSGNYKRACVAEFSGVNAFDSKATAKDDQSSATTHTTNDVTPTAGLPAVLVAAIGKDANNESLLAFSGGVWTTIDIATCASGFNPQYAIGYRIITETSGSYSATATEARSTAWCGNIAAFVGEMVAPVHSFGVLIA